MIAELDRGDPLPPGPPVEPAHAGDQRRARQRCPECEKTVGNLPSHLAQVHGIRGANAGKGKRDRAPSSARNDDGKPKPPSPAELGDAIGFLYGMAGEIWAVSDPICGGALKASAPTLGKAWQNACEQSPAVQRFAASMMGGGALVGLAMAHIPLFAVVIQHHGPAAREAQREAEAEAWHAEQARRAEEGDPDAWIPPGAVPPDEAYGPYTPGSADSAR